MSNSHMAVPADGGPDDLPRTLRREREAREREARERGSALPAASFAGDSPSHVWHDDAQPAIVTAIKVPFLQLMLFFIKAVLAAIPALVLLGAILWTAGHLLQTYFPWIVKMRILIHFPG